MGRVRHNLLFVDCVLHRLPYLHSLLSDLILAGHFGLGNGIYWIRHGHIDV